jgi:hypothetical protein
MADGRAAALIFADDHRGMGRGRASIVAFDDWGDRICRLVKFSKQHRAILSRIVRSALPAVFLRADNMCL